MYSYFKLIVTNINVIPMYMFVMCMSNVWSVAGPEEQGDVGHQEPGEERGGGGTVKGTATGPAAAAGDRHTRGTAGS